MINHKGLAWCNKPYFYFMKKYWPEAKHILSAEDPYEDIPYIRPPGSDEPGGIPNDSWVDAFAWSLDQIEEEFVVYMHPDYWVSERVNNQTMEEILEYMKTDENILRINIGRGYGFGSRGDIITQYKSLTIKECTNRNCFHQVSLTPGLWRISQLKKLIQAGKGWNSWNMEQQGLNSYLHEHTYMRSLVISPEPVLISNAIYARNNNKVSVLPQIEEEVRNLIPEEIRVN